MLRKLLKPIIIYIALIALSLPLILPYFHSGYFPTHDGLWAVVRLGDMFRELKDLQFPARYSGNLNFGYGYPLFNFAYPFPYYFGILFHFVGLSFINTMKLLFALTVPLSAVGMYAASCKLWGKKEAGIVSALLYVYLPYRMVDLYVRGSIGESISFAIFPLLILSVLHIVEKPTSKRWMVIGGVLLATLVTSHNIMATLFTPTLIAFGLVMGWKKKKVFLTLLQSLILGVFLSAFFWLPALAEKHLILLAKIPIANRDLYYVSLKQLVLPSWNYGVPDAANGFTYQIGLPLVIIVLFIVGYLFYQKTKKSSALHHSYAAITLSIAILIMVGMLFPFSKVIWEHTPLLKEINYPWTFLGPLGFVITLLSGYVMTIQSNIVRWIAIVAVIAEILLVIPYAKPEKYVYFDDNYFLTNDATTTSSTEYIPLWVKKWPIERPEPKVTVTQGTVQNITANSKRVQFVVASNKPTTVTINTIYYPGWIVKVDNVFTPIQYQNPKGVMQVAVDKGSHTVVAKFGETPLRAAADAVSLASVFFAISYIIISFIPGGKKKQ